MYRVYVKQLLAALYTQVWLQGQLLQATLQRQYGGMETDNTEASTDPDTNTDTDTDPDVLNGDIA